MGKGAGKFQQHGEQQREEQIMQELRETRRERDELAQRVAFLEARLASASPMSDGGTTGDVGGAVQYLTRRVSELEREEGKWRVQRKAAEDRVSELLALAAGALDDNRYLGEASAYPRSRKMTRSESSRLLWTCTGGLASTHACNGLHET